MKEFNTEICFDTDEFISNKISTDFIDKFKKLNGSKFHKIQTILSIKELIKNELKKECGSMFSNEDYEIIFNKYENKFLAYLQKSKKNKKKILKNTIVAQYKRHYKRFKDVISFKNAILFKNIDINSKKSLKTLFKMELVKLTKNFEKIHNKNTSIKLFLIIFMNLFLSSISIFMLFLLWKFSFIITSLASEKIKKIKICKKYLKKQHILQLNKFIIVFKLYYNGIVNYISNHILSVSNFIGNALHKISNLLTLNISNSKYAFQPVHITKQYVPKDIEYSIFMKNINDIIKQITEKIDYNFYNILF